MLSENGLTEAERDKLWATAVAAFAQECLHCHRVIQRGGSVVCGAINVFTRQPVWTHPPCAQFMILALGERAVVDDGWRQATAPQRCGRCRDDVKPGQKIYRLWPEVPTLNPVLGYACHRCWRRATTDWIEDL